MPGLQTSAVRIARTIGQASSGRIKIEVFPAGAFVRPFETFEAVGAGIADMYHSFEGYFTSKSPALNFFSAIPDALSGQFNIKSLLCTSTGCQMGGWFAREITSPEQYKGLRYRMAGPGAEVLRRLGATVVTLPGGEIMEALQSGAIDACEWIGPWLDMSIGLHKAVGYYYYPGFHEPGSGFSLGINKRLWESLDPGDRELIEANATCEYTRSLAEFDANNALWLHKLRHEGSVKSRKFDDSVLKALREISKEVVAEIGSGDETAKKIYASYQQFRTLITDWSDISERAVLNSRVA
jgi:TRAP-type mannitol/chloroaromatic compound transport system substrate-binding protein